jgi:hypothetical protein
MKKAFFLYIILILLIFTNCSFAQTAKEILQKSVNAHGGLEKLTNWKSMKLTGEIIMDQTKAIKMRGTLSRVAVKPDKLRIDQDFTAFEPNNVFRTYIYNKDEGWAIINLIPYYSDSYKSSLKTTLDKSDGVAYYLKNSLALNLKQETKINGKSLYVLESVQEKDTSYLFIDKNKYFLVRDSLRNVTMVYNEFKDVDGAIIPVKYDQIVYSPQRIATHKFKIDKAEFNTDIDPTIFEEEKPKKK